MKHFILFTLGGLVLIALIMQNDPDLGPLIREFHIITVSILLEALPFILLGALVSGIIEVTISRDRFARLIPANPLAALGLAGLLGLAFPICECGIIPVVRRLIRKGVPFHLVITYMLAAPIVNPVVILATIVAFRGSPALVPVTAGRIAGGFLIAVAIGALTARMARRIPPLPAASAPASNDHAGHDAGDHDHDDCGCADHDHADACAHDAPARTGFLAGARRVLGHAADDFFTIGPYLILGACIAGLMRSVAVTTDGTTHRLTDLVLGAGPRQVPLMMAMAFLLSLCSEADAFFARAFAVGTPGTLAFLVLGPMLDIKLILMYFRVFTPRFIAFLVTAIIVINLLVWLAAAFVMGGG
ncbi:MAG: permease [Planctomycetota bacterium]